MELIFTRQAKQDLDDLSPAQVEAIKQQLEALRAHPTSHEDTKLIRLKDRRLYRLKITEERGGAIDHRVIYDITDGTIRIYSIFHRDHGYTDPSDMQHSE